MDSSRKRGVPFQTVTRNRSRALTAEVPPIPISNVKVVLNKMNTSLLKHSKNSSPSPKKRSRISSPMSNQANSKKQENVGHSNILHVASTSQVEVIDLSNSASNSSSPTKKKTPPKTTNTKFRKPRTANKKKKTSGVKMAKTPKSKASRSSASSCTGSKDCHECLKKEESISVLESKLKKLEEKEGSIQGRLSLYEGLGLSHLQKEEENKSLLKQKLEFQKKLCKVEEELQSYLNKEDNEIKMLIQRKKTLKRKLSIKMEKCEKEDAKEEKELNEVRESIVQIKELEAKCQKELEELKKEIPVLDKKVAEEKEKFELRPKEVPVVEPIYGPCEICKNLRDEIRLNKKECQDAEKQNPLLHQELRELIIKMLDGAFDNAHLSLEVEYMKNRLLSERECNSEDERNRQYGLRKDYYDRQEFVLKMCNLMDKHFSTKRYNPEPISAVRMPKSEFEIKTIERISAEGLSICCAKFQNSICRKYFCGRYNTSENMTEEHKNKHKRTSHSLIPRSGLNTKEERDEYVRLWACRTLIGYDIKNLAFIKLK